MWPLPVPIDLVVPESLAGLQRCTGALLPPKEISGALNSSPVYCNGLVCGLSMQFLSWLDRTVTLCLPCEFFAVWLLLLNNHLANLSRGFGSLNCTFLLIVFCSSL